MASHVTCSRTKQCGLKAKHSHLANVLNRFGIRNEWWNEKVPFFRGQRLAKTWHHVLCEQFGYTVAVSWMYFKSTAVKVNVSVQVFFIRWVKLLITCESMIIFLGRWLMLMLCWSWLAFPKIKDRQKSKISDLHQDIDTCQMHFKHMFQLTFHI